MAGLRSRSTRGAGYWNWHDWTARIEHLIPPRKQGLESQNPATRCVSRRGFSRGRQAGRPSRYGTRDRWKRCPSGPDVTLQIQRGRNPRHTLRPVAGFSFGRRTGRPLPRKSRPRRRPITVVSAKSEFGEHPGTCHNPPNATGGDQPTNAAACRLVRVAMGRGVKVPFG